MTRVTLYGESCSLKALQSAMERLMPTSGKASGKQVTEGAGTSRQAVWSLVESRIMRGANRALTDTIDWVDRAYVLDYPLDKIVFTLMPTVHVEGLFESHTFETEQRLTKIEADFIVTFFVALSATGSIWQGAVSSVCTSDAAKDCR